MFVLPSERLLQYYKNSVQQEPGLNEEVFQLMREEAEKRNIPQFGRLGGIMLDEMAIQEDLQLKSQNGVMELVGLVNMGDEDTLIRQLQTG